MSGGEVGGGDEGGAEVVGFLVVDGAGGTGDEEFVDGGAGGWWCGAAVVVEVGGAVLGDGGDVGVVGGEEVGEGGAWSAFVRCVREGGWSCGVYRVCKSRLDRRWTSRILAGCCCLRRRIVAGFVCSRRWLLRDGSSATDYAILPRRSKSRCSESRSFLGRKQSLLDSPHGSRAEDLVLCGSSPNRLLPSDSHPSHSLGLVSLTVKKDSLQRRYSYCSENRVPSKPC